MCGVVFARVPTFASSASNCCRPLWHKLCFALSKNPVTSTIDCDYVHREISVWYTVVWHCTYAQRADDMKDKPSNAAIDLVRMQPEANNGRTKPDSHCESLATQD